MIYRPRIIQTLSGEWFLTTNRYENIASCLQTNHKQEDSSNVLTTLFAQKINQRFSYCIFKIKWNSWKVTLATYAKQHSPLKHTTQSSMSEAAEWKELNIHSACATDYAQYLVLGKSTCTKHHPAGWCSISGPVPTHFLSNYPPPKLAQESSRSVNGLSTGPHVCCDCDVNGLAHTPSRQQTTEFPMFLLAWH